MDSKCCFDCGAEFPYLQKHHLIPRSEGGSNDAGNLVLLCPNCHSLRHGGMDGIRQMAHSAQSKEKSSRSLRLYIDEHQDEFMARCQRIATIKKGGNPDRWSNKHDACVECFTTEKPHVARGLCGNCYQRLNVNARKQPNQYWAITGSVCRDCGETKRPHQGGGLCSACYQRHRWHGELQPKKPRGKWAINFDACIDCGRNDRPHAGHGLCNACRRRVARSIPSV